MKQQRSQQSGFTLVETVIALLILMVVFLGAASLFAYSIRYNTGADDRALALALAEQRLEQLRVLPFNDAALNQTPNNGNDGVQEAPDPKHGGRTFRVTKFVKNEGTGVKLITIVVLPRSVNGRWAQQAVTVRTRRTTTASGPYL